MNAPPQGTRAELERLIDLLQAQREAARTIDPTALSGLTKCLSQLCDRFEGTGLVLDRRERELLERARHLAALGLRDLRATLNGVETVIGQLRAASGAVRHGVYGPGGERLAIALPRPALERRR